MSIRHATGDITQERLDELALGRINPKTGKRTGGFIGAVRKMKQNQEAVAIGEMDEDDLINKAYDQAWSWIKRQAAANAAPDTADEEDAAYAVAQEERYRNEYEWDDANANDDASLTALITLEVEQRKLKRDLARPGIPWKEKVELLGELRQLAKTHSEIQKALNFDKTTRETRRRSEDPMTALRGQIESGAARMQALIDEAPEFAAQANTLEELRSLMKHTSGLPYAWIDTWLAAHARVIGVDG